MNTSHILLKWYKENKRDLPWRHDRSPYKIWVSEIILQQTRVNQGMAYYLKFLKYFPDIKTLAESPLEILLKVWEGLGYYSRARNMHIAANQIVNDYKSEFPDSYNELLKLKGVGKYTAAAIASICFNEQVPVIDGNVFRVLSRLFGIFDDIKDAASRKVFEQKANELISKEYPGDFNQAIMEFGALQCVPKSPSCESCVLNPGCFAYINNNIEELPVNNKSVKVKNRFLLYIVIIENDSTYVRMRKHSDIWKGLNEFYLIELNEKANKENIIKIVSDEFKNNSINFKLMTPWLKHQLTHRNIWASFVVITANGSVNLKEDYRKIKTNELSSIAFPRLITRFLSENEIFIQDNML